MGPPSLLVVGLNYAPEPVGIGPYTAGLCEALVRSGHRVTAIVGKPYYPRWRADPAYAGGWLEAEENGVRLVRCPHYVPQDPVGIRRFGHLISYAITALVPAVRIARRERPQVVFALPLRCSASSPRSWRLGSAGRGSGSMSRTLKWKPLSQPV